MVAVSPHPAATAKEPVHRLCKPDGEALQAAREHPAVVRFDNEVNVVSLDGELKDSESASRTRREPPLELTEHVLPPQRREPALSAQRRVYGVAAFMGRPSSMGHADLASGWLAAGAGASTAPGTRTELELNGGTCHLV